MSDDAQYAEMLAVGCLLNYYQPVVDLRSGKVLGLEALGRIVDGDRIVPPGVFLPHLSDDALEALLFASVPQGLATLEACSATYPGLSISYNVSPRTVLRAGFVTNLLNLLEQVQGDPRLITLEILETDEFLDGTGTRERLRELREGGIRIALDDVGAGYSSLIRLQKFPIDTIKLDQAFVRELTHSPEGLHVVTAMRSLARSMRIRFVVEGVETVEIMEALGVLGVGAAQGYAIARPMPETLLVDWLASHKQIPAPRDPRSLLGAYAAHLSIVEAVQATHDQPSLVTLAGGIKDPHACDLGRYFDAEGLHDTEFGLAHKVFHQLIDCHSSDPQAWDDAAANLWRTLQLAMEAANRPDRESETSSQNFPGNRDMADAALV